MDWAIVALFVVTAVDGIWLGHVSRRLYNLEKQYEGLRAVVMGEDE